MTRPCAIALAVAAAAGACSGRKAAPAGAHVGPAIAAALNAAGAAGEPWRCAAPDGPGAPDESLAVGGRTWRITGHALTLVPRGDAARDPPPGDAGPRAAEDLAIGVIADAAGSAPSTLAALRRLRDKLAHVDVLVSLGGMGSSAAELDAVFAALADRAPWPLVALPGDLEAVPAQIAAIAAARRRGAPVVDGRLVQRIELPGVTIAVVPGAAAMSRLAAGADGCGYRRQDVAAAFAALTPLPGLRVVAAAEPPRVTEGDLPTGEIAVTVGGGAQVDLALYAATRGGATGPRAGGRDGGAIAVTPGSSDATARLPDARRAPSAGIVTVHAGAWAWRPIDDVN